jgi:hypothetical protein
MCNVFNLHQKNNEYMPAGSSCESAKGDGGEMSGTGDVGNDGDLEGDGGNGDDDVQMEEAEEIPKVPKQGPPRKKKNERPPYDNDDGQSTSEVGPSKRRKQVGKRPETNIPSHPGPSPKKKPAVSLPSTGSLVSFTS